MYISVCKRPDALALGGIRWTYCLVDPIALRFVGDRRAGNVGHSDATNLVSARQTSMKNSLSVFTTTMTNQKRRLPFQPRAQGSSITPAPWILSKLHGAWDSSVSVLCHCLFKLHDYSLLQGFCFLWCKFMSSISADLNWSPTEGCLGLVSAK